MTNLTAEQEVWVRAYCAIRSQAINIDAGWWANQAVKDFNTRFPSPSVEPTHVSTEGRFTYHTNLPK